MSGRVLNSPLPDQFGSGPRRGAQASRTGSPRQPGRARTAPGPRVVASPWRWGEGAAGPGVGFGEALAGEGLFEIDEEPARAAIGDDAVDMRPGAVAAVDHRVEEA